MPIRLSTTLPALAFATEIEDLEFSSDTPGTTCHISITLGGAVVLDTYLTPDTRGHFALHDLGWLISTHATAAMATRGKWLTELRIEADSKLLATVSIMPCRQRLYINGADFVQRSFLTLAGGGCKVVPKLATERLVWKPSDEERKQERPVSVRVTYMDLNTGETRRVGSEFRAEEYNDELLCYNTSPAYIVGNLEQFGPMSGATRQPVGYEVTVGKRTMRYRLAPWDMDAAPVTTLDFTNVFGLSDSLYIYGEVEEALKPTYTQVVVGGSAYNANVEAQAEFKATTGALSAADVALLKDVATARYVWHDDSAVTITAAEVKGSNAYNTADSATLTWRESQSGLSVLTPLPVRTFDETFDETFL
nr:MAG TPA: hypothetical protein [Caudoviricetes sp.]